MLPSKKIMMVDSRLIRLYFVKSFILYHQLLLLNTEFISHTIHRSNIIGRAGLYYFFTEVLYMCVYEIVVVGQVHIIAPQVLGNGCLADDLIFITDEIEQQL